MGSVAAIEMRNVNFAYNGVPVLMDVNFRIERGDFISVVGPNGGGKTTLLKLILGLIKPKSGSVRVFGTLPEKSRERMGYMPQHQLFDPQFPVSVMDVILMGNLGLRRSGPYSKSDRSTAERALGEVEMAKYLKQSFSNLSGGQRQRVLLARALICQPDILLLDEPTANIDMEIESKLDSILKELNQRMTILMVTHDLGLVIDMVKSVVCVNRRVAIHPTSALNGKLIQELYGTDLRLVRHDRITGEEVPMHD